MDPPARQDSDAVVHSVELLFDEHTDTALRTLWQTLAEAGIRSPRPGSRPHVTLAVAEGIDPGVDPRLAALADRFPLGCRIGAPLLFGRDRPVLARLVLPTAELLDLHQQVHRRCLEYLRPAPMANAEPGRWTAHVTLARRVGSAQLAAAVRIAGTPAEISGSFVGLRRWDGDARKEHPI